MSTERWDELRAALASGDQAGASRIRRQLLEAVGADPTSWTPAFEAGKLTEGVEGEEAELQLAEDLLWALGRGAASIEAALPPVRAATDEEVASYFDRGPEWAHEAALRREELVETRRQASEIAAEVDVLRSERDALLEAEGAARQQLLRAANPYLRLRRLFSRR